MNIRFDRVSSLQTGAIAALLLFSVCGPVPAFANSDTDAQIQRLENEIQTLSRAVFKDEKPPAGAASSSVADQSVQADMQNRMSEMQMTIQQLTGKVEEQGNTIDALKDQIARSGAGNVAPANGGSPYGMTSTQSTPVSPPQPVTATTSTYTYNSKPTGTPDASAAPSDEGFSMTDPNAPAPANAPTAGQLGSMTTNVDQNGNATPASTAGTPTSEYEAAFTMLRNQDYPGAQTAFDAFIKKYPDNSLVPNAMYWLGETYYVRNQFDQATKIFAETYQKYPKGAKAPDNLLKLGMSLAGQGKTKEACIALAQLKKQYPAGSAPVLTRGDQEIEHLKCNTQ